MKYLVDFLQFDNTIDFQQIFEEFFFALVGVENEYINCDTRLAFDPENGAIYTYACSDSTQYTPGELVLLTFHQCDFVDWFEDICEIEAFGRVDDSLSIDEMLEEYRNTVFNNSYFYDQIGEDDLRKIAQFNKDNCNLINKLHEAFRFLKRTDEYRQTCKEIYIDWIKVNYSSFEEFMDHQEVVEVINDYYGIGSQCAFYSHDLDTYCYICKNRLVRLNGDECFTENRIGLKN